MKYFVQYIMICLISITLTVAEAEQRVPLSTIQALLRTEEYDKAAALFHDHIDDMTDLSPEDRDQMLGDFDIAIEALKEQHRKIDALFGYCYTKNPAHASVNCSLDLVIAMKNALVSSH